MSIRLVFSLLLAAAGLASFHAAVSQAQQAFPEGAQVSAVGSVAFTEGPVWHPDGSVYFSDITNDRIMRVDPQGTLGVFRSPSGKANGLVFDHQGRLVACEGETRRITRTELDGTITVLADQFDGKKFNSPNDITIDSKGNLYFTDPRYGNRDTVEMFDAQGKSIEGVYRISVDGTVTRVLAQEIERPNGIAVSPDDRFLFVAVNTNDAEGRARQLWRFDLNQDGSVNVDRGKILFDWGTERGPDGMAISRNGLLFVTAGLNHPAPPYETADKYKAAVYVISPEGGLVDLIPVPMDMITNCAFGGADRKTLYITAGHTLWSVPVSEPGFTPWPRD